MRRRVIPKFILGILKIITEALRPSILRSGDATMTATVRKDLNLRDVVRRVVKRSVNRCVMYVVRKPIKFTDSEYGFSSGRRRRLSVVIEVIRERKDVNESVMWGNEHEGVKENFKATSSNEKRFRNTK